MFRSSDFYMATTKPLTCNMQLVARMLPTSQFSWNLFLLFIQTQKKRKKHQVITAIQRGMSVYFSIQSLHLHVLCMLQLTRQGNEEKITGLFIIFTCGFYFMALVLGKIGFSFTVSDCSLGKKGRTTFLTNNIMESGRATELIEHRETFKLRKSDCFEVVQKTSFVARIYTRPRPWGYTTNFFE